MNYYYEKKMGPVKKGGNGMRQAFLCILLGLMVFSFSLQAQNESFQVNTHEPEPELTIPFCSKPPVIDGDLSDEAWKYSARIGMFEAYPSYVPRAMRAEQVDYYVSWDAENLYVAMDSLESNTNTLIANCITHDHIGITSNDCIELMLFPGRSVKQADIPVYYLVINSIGTVWDTRFFPLYNEQHNSWESNAVIANQVEGTRWTIEVKLPLKSFVKNLPNSGDVWRMNFVRTYSGYCYSAWNARGSFNKAHVGGEVSFSRDTAAARIASAVPLTEGNLGLTVELANPTSETKSVTWILEGKGRNEKGEALKISGKDQKTVFVKPGEKKEIQLGNSQLLQKTNYVTLKALDEKNNILLAIYNRKTLYPPLRMRKKLAPRVPLVGVFPKFYPSLEQLDVIVDYTAWTKKKGVLTDSVQANITVFPKGSDAKDQAVLSGEIEKFKDCRGTWSASTKKLPEGEYDVKVCAKTNNNEILTEYSDWFVKKMFPWMTKKAGTEDVLAPLYKPLTAKGRTVKPWGRIYEFGKDGLLQKVVSQNKPLLLAPMKWAAELDGKPVKTKVTKSFSFTEITPTVVHGTAELEIGSLPVTVNTKIEYDGFILYRVIYGRKGTGVRIGRLRLSAPLDARFAKFYSASGDPQGTSVMADVFPEGEGKVFDSLTTTRSVCCSPSFATLFWTADYNSCFCYAADNDKGWIIRDDKPAVEAWRKGNELNLWLNLIDRSTTINDQKTLEFSFQAGPVKPMPEGWRGWQDGGDPRSAPVTLLQKGGSGTLLRGGTHFMGPSKDDAIRRKNIERLKQMVKTPGTTIIGYHYWGNLPKGHEAARVFRGEWGVSKEKWNGTKKVREREWKKRFYGENKDLCIILNVRPVPSFVDYLSDAWRQVLKEHPIEGFYDDVGYPKPVFAPELGMGFIREDGRKVWSSGQWVYRDRWKRVAQLNSLAGKRNLTRDSQHVIAHYLPAYNFIGIWAPCERGYYNPFKDRDNYEFYGSLERYYAYNPHMAFGQPAMIGMSSPQTRADLFCRDTRVMMMLTMLHDQDVGSFGSRDLREVCRLRYARNRFKQWGKDVTFTGWWESGDLVKAKPDPDIVVSLYQQPGEAMFIIANRGDKETQAIVRPNWRKLKLASKHEIINIESLARLTSDNDSAFSISVPRHEARLIIAAPQGRYPAEPAVPGSGLPKPAKILPELCDDFNAKELAPAWIHDHHEGGAYAGQERGRLWVQGDPYGFSHMRRPLNVDNVTIQCQMVYATGGSPKANPGLMLCWSDGAYARVSVDIWAKKFFYSADKTSHKGSELSEVLDDEYPYRRDWLRIKLTPQKIIFCSSNDGVKWREDWSIIRTEQFAGAPAWLMLGNGWPGKNPHLDNVYPKNFNPENKRPRPYVFFDNLIVGRE